MRAAAWASLLAAGLAAAARPAAAQRVPERFGPSVTWRRSAGGAAPLAMRVPARVALPAPARRDSGLTVGVFAAEVVAGSIGAAAGFYAGAAAGGRSCEVAGGCQGGEDPGLGRAIVGALGGAWLGTAVLSHVAGGLAGGPAGRWGGRLGAAAGGVVVALVAAAVLQADFDRPATWIPVPVVAAAVTALAVPRHR